MSSFRKEMYEGYKETRDNRPKIDLYIFQVAGGWSGVLTMQGREDSLYNLSVNDTSHSDDSLLTLKWGLVSLARVKGWRVTKVILKSDQGLVTERING